MKKPSKKRKKQVKQTFKKSERSLIETKAIPIRPLRPSGRIMVLILLPLLAIGMGYIAKDFWLIATTGKAFGVDLASRAIEKYSVETIITTQRGTIYDNEGNPLAEELRSYTLYANLNPDYETSYVEDPEKTARELSEHLSVDYETLYEKLSRTDISQVQFGAATRSLSYVEKNEIENLNLPGIFFIENSKRFYPNDVFASHTIGYSVYDTTASRLVGHMGLELYFDDILAGQNGIASYLRDRKGYQLPNSKRFDYQEAIQGMDIYTTLDFKLQTLLEDAFDVADEEYQPERLIGVIANAKTGEILALANRQTFDPNLRDVENYYNPILQDPFEPGSTIKIYTYAAAINEGVYNGQRYYPTGSISVANMNIKDWKVSGWGSITLDQGFYVSSNTGIITMLTSMLETDTYLEYLEAFGFGSQTGLELPQESSGTLPRENDYTNQLTAGFGQGFLVTPIQQIQALSAIVNDGKMLKPYLVSRIYDPNIGEDAYVAETQISGEPISASTAKQVRDLMYGVVHDEKFGSGYQAYRMEDITVAGKTGTAQIADIENGGYLRGSTDYVYSFIGFAPYEDPEYLFYFAIDRPQAGAMTGHGVLGRALKYILNNSLGYETAEPATLKQESAYELTQTEHYLNLTIDEAVKQVEEQGLTPVVIGSGDVVYNQKPSANQSIIKGEKVFLQTGGVTTLPDLTDWSKQDLTVFAQLTSIQFNMSGEGKTYTQSVIAGTPIDANTTCDVQLSMVPVTIETPLDETESTETDNTELPQGDIWEEIPPENAEPSTELESALEN